MKSKTTYRILSLFTVLILFIGCKQEDAPNFHFEYFGLAEGRFVVYDVVEINHDSGLLIHDTLRYQMKTYWGDVYVDNEGREGREYIVYKRDSVNHPWTLTDVWHGVFDGIRGELVEENQRKVKLVFAPTLSKNWDANAYNLDDELDCYYRDIHSDTIINNYKFDSTLVVEQQTYNYLIDSVRMYETYAKHIGLVYKHHVDNHYQFGSTEVVIGKELYVSFITSGWE